MTTWRALLAVAAAGVLAVAALNITLWHAAFWLPIGFYATLVIVLAIFEVGRYRPAVDRSSITWRATDEKFLDPTTGQSMTVYYDPATGKRDYR
jgi:hypothetical protein